MNLISIKNITKKFDTIIAINDVSIEINKGEMFAIVGADGAGKSTLIKMICGINNPDVGDITLFGLNFKKNRREIIKKIGYLSQKFSLYGDLTIDENIQFFAEVHGVKNYEKRRDELLEFTRLKKFRNRLASKLSGGMKQKLALSCTLIHNPEILLLDEPTTGVDPVSRRDFWKILSNILHTGITIILTTPYLDEAERCHRVAMIDKGKIMKVDTPQNLKASLNYGLYEIVCSDIQNAYSIIKNFGNIIEAQIFGDRIDIGLDNEEDLRLIEKLLIESGIEIISKRNIIPTLENIFISLLTKEKKTLQ